MDELNYQVVTTGEQLRAAVDHLSKCDVIGFDTETTSLDPLLGRMRLLQLAASDTVYVIDLDRFANGDARKTEALAPVRELLAAPRPVKVAHNAKFDAKWTAHYLGAEMGGLFDSLLASQLISAGEQEDRHNLEAVAGRFLGEAIDKSEQLSDWSGELSESQLRYAARDAAVMLPLREKMVGRLRSDELVRCAQLEFECVMPVAALELTGIYLDKERWREVLGAVEKKRATLAEDLQDMLSEGASQGMLFANARTDINLDSHTQLTAALKRLGVPVPDSTRNWKLQPLAKDYPAVAKLLEYRTVQKALTSYGENILDEISPVTGRIHANFHQIGAPTGRFSCLTGDTLVSMATGLKRMDAVRVGDYVATTYGLKKVERAWMTGARPVYKITLQDGREIRATEDHRFLAGQADVWKRLDELKIGENLFVSLRRDNDLTGGQPPHLPIIEAEEIRARKIVKVPTDCRGANIKAESVAKLTAQFGLLPSLAPVQAYINRELRAVKIVAIEPDGEAPVYDITVEGVHEFIANSIVVHNCTHPNIQQVPHSIEYRRCFRAPEGRKLVTADYSQIELRILAEFTGDQGFIEAFRTGADLHRVTAAQVFGVSQENVTAEQRSFAKRLNFGVVYGIGAQRFSMMTGISLTESEDILRRYFSTYRALDAWLRDAARQAVRERTAPRTVAGRLARFNFDPADKQAVSLVQRNGKNSPVQGCVNAGTRVFEESRGYVPIETLVDHCVSVWDGSQFSSAEVAHSGRKKLVKVTLWGGYYIECSPNHKFLTVDVNGREKWRTPAEFVKGCWVVLSETVPEWSGELCFPELQIGRAHNANRSSLADMSDKAGLGVWLGRLASDGSLGERQLRLLIAEHEEVLLPEVKSLSENFGHVSHRVGRGGRGTMPIHELTVSALGLCRQLNDSGVKTRIPDFAWASSTLLAGYLRRMFDGDGTVNKDGPVLCFGQGGRHLCWAREVQQALLLFGVRSRINICAEQINVCVLKRDSAIFAQKIGFMNPHKQAKVEAISSTQRDGKIYGRAARIKSIEFTNQLVDMYDVVDSSTGRFMANGLITHNSSADILKRALRLLHDKLRGTTARIINIVHDEVVVEADENQAAEIAQTVEDAMCAAGEEYVKTVPIKVESEIADDWVKN